MTNTKHTPGPWHVGLQQPISDKFIYGSKGEAIADCDQLTNFPDENLANARLIAASPTLYDYAVNRAENGCEEAKSMLASLNLTK